MGVHQGHHIAQGVHPTAIARRDRQIELSGGDELLAFIRDDPLSGRRCVMTATGYVGEGETLCQPLPIVK